LFRALFANIDSGNFFLFVSLRKNRLSLTLVGLDTRAAFEEFSLRIRNEGCSINYSNAGTRAAPRIQDPRSDPTF